MKRLLVAFLLILLLPTIVVSKPNDNSSTNVATALIDCMSASIVSYYSEVTLPDSTVAVFADTNLPARITFFLADPYEIISTIESKLGVDSVKSFFSLFSKKNDSYLSSFYNNVGSRKYKEQDYLISGSLMFTYEEGTTLDTITSLFLNKKSSDNPIQIDIECVVIGKAVSDKITVKGSFIANVTTEGEIEFNSIGEYSVNAYTLTNGVYCY